MPATKQIANRRGEKTAAKKVGGKRKKVDSEDEAFTCSKAATKKEKDPNAPKKPMTSYFHFMNAKRKETKEADPSLTFGTLTKKLTDLWRNIDPEDKKIYENLAAKDKLRYQDEMEAKGLLKKKPVVDTDAPKKAQSSFFLFSHEARERIKKT